MFFSAHVAVADLTKMLEEEMKEKKCIFFSLILVPENISTQNQPNALQGKSGNISHWIVTLKSMFEKSLAADLLVWPFSFPDPY